MIQLVLALGMILANASMYYCSLEDEVLGDCDSVGWQLQAPQAHTVAWPDENVWHELCSGVCVHFVDDVVVLEHDHIAPLVADGESDGTGQTVGNA